MLRRLVVEVKLVALMADLRQTAGAGKPLHWSHRQRQLGLWVVDGFQRLAVETIQQIHQQQFLVLLLVLQSQLHQGRDPLRRILQKRLQPGVHPLAPGQHFGNGRPA